ncbi:hypothetical protein [Nonlabens sp.]|uniref:hypothetical protein n=1 Tax=Nonlabens sp. TaxID=1888209 RepID=UPI003F6980A2
MKKLKNIFAIVATTLLISSCDKGLGADLDCEYNYGKMDREIGVNKVNEFVTMRNSSSSISNGIITYEDNKGAIKQVSLSTEVHFKVDDVICYLKDLEKTYGTDYTNLGLRAYMAIENKDGKDVTTIVFAPTGTLNESNAENSILNPNIEGANLLNHGSTGMPPYGVATGSQQLTNP